MFDLRKSTMSRALLLESVFSTASLYRAVIFFFVVMTGGLLLWLAAPDVLGERRSLGIFLIFAGLTFALWTYSLYYNFRIKVVRVTAEDQNLADHLDFKAAIAVSRMLRKHHGTETLLQGLIEIKGADFVFLRLGINPKKITELIQQNKNVEQELTGEELNLFLEEALNESRLHGTEVISWRELLVALAVHSEFLRKYLFDNKIEKKDVREISSWQSRLENQEERKKEFWTRENLFSHRGIGKSWATGYTVTLDRFAKDLSVLADDRQKIKIYGRKLETEQIERVLARDGQNNVVVVGEEGVGKKTLAFAMAERIASGEVLPQLAYKRVMELDVAAVLAGSTSTREVEARLKKILNEAVRAGNIILLIDDMHTLFSREGGAGEIDATQLMLPYLESSNFQVIGLTDFQSYHDVVMRNTALSRSFEKVEMNEPEIGNVMKILEEVVPRIEAHGQVLITFAAMKQALSMSDRYIKDQPFPEKAIHILQEAAVRARSQRRSPLVKTEDVEEVVHRKTEIPVGEIALAEKQTLLHLEKILHRRVIGQDEAIVAIANAMRRSRSGIASEKKPIGSFLFMGPTGVGKTETAKTLAQVYFGSEKRMLRFDMSEYQNADSLVRIIGGGSERGILTREVIDSPFSLLLLDEIEKAHPDILNLFLQVLDDGRLTDNTGRTVDFTNTIIIATSNAGAELIRQSVKEFRDKDIKERLLDYLQKEGLFRPEFLNRFDALIIFKPLTEDQTGQVAELMFNDLNRRLKTKEIQVNVTPELIAKVSKLGYSPEYGARPLRRVIQDKIEDIIAKKLLSGEIQRGQTVTINHEELV